MQACICGRDCDITWDVVSQCWEDGSTTCVCFQLSSNLFVTATATMIVTDQIPTVPDVTTSAQCVSRSYCGEIIHCQLCWICSCGNETISYFYEWTQQTHSLHLCRSMAHTGTLLLCFMVRVLFISEPISEPLFWTYFSKYSAGKHYMDASFCQCVLLSWNHQCCIKPQCSESNRRAYSWCHSSFQCLKHLFNNCFTIWSSLYQMNLMLYNVCRKTEL